jgi:tryptophan halogenase
MKLLDYFPDRNCDPKVVERFNIETALSYEAIRDFIIAHYKVTERDDTPFWAYCKNMSIPDSLTEKLELFRIRGAALPDYYDLFREGSWFAVLYGQGITPQGYHALADALSEDELRVKLSQIRASVQKRVAGLPPHEVFIQRYCAAPGV